MNISCQNSYFAQEQVLEQILLKVKTHKVGLISTAK